MPNTSNWSDATTGPDVPERWTMPKRPKRLPYSAGRPDAVLYEVQLASSCLCQVRLVLRARPRVFPIRLRAALSALGPATPREVTRCLFALAARTLLTGSTRHATLTRTS